MSFSRMGQIRGAPVAEDRPAYKMGRQVNQGGVGKHYQGQPQPWGHHGLRMLAAWPEDTVEGTNRIGEEEAEWQDQPRQHGLSDPGTAVIAESPDQPQDEKGKPGVVKRKRADDQGDVGPEHVVRPPGQEVSGEQSGQEIGQPDQGRQEDGHRLHTRQEPALAPQGRYRQEKCNVAKPEEIGGSVETPVVRHEDGDEQGIGNSKKQRNLRAMR